MSPELERLVVDTVTVLYDMARVEGWAPPAEFADPGEVAMVRDPCPCCGAELYVRSRRAFALALFVKSRYGGDQPSRTVEVSAELARNEAELVILEAIRPSDLADAMADAYDLFPVIFQRMAESRDESDLAERAVDAGRRLRPSSQRMRAVAWRLRQRERAAVARAVRRRAGGRRVPRRKSRGSTRRARAPDRPDERAEPPRLAGSLPRPPAAEQDVPGLTAGVSDADLLAVLADRYARLVQLVEIVVYLTISSAPPPRGRLLLDLIRGVRAQAGTVGAAGDAGVAAWGAPVMLHEESVQAVVDALVAAQRGAKAAGAGASRGGRPLKQHPGLALREAARLCTQEPDVALTRVAAQVTSYVERKAREGKVAQSEIDARHWTTFSWDQAQLLQRAVQAQLVRWTPAGLEIRTNRRGVFRKVAEIEWLAIPRGA